VLILALDTTSRAGSLAIVRDGVLVHEISGDAALTHGQRLPLEFTRVCEGAGVLLRDVDLFAVAAGPGSFTGLRVGIAAIQGLAVALDRRVVPVSTFEAVAAAAPRADDHIGAWVDAQRGEVFAQLLKRGPGPRDGAAGGFLNLEGVRPPLSATPEAVLEAWREGNAFDRLTFHGDGALRYADRIRSVVGASARIAHRVELLAGAIGRIAASQPERAVTPHAIVPVYVRRPDAELARARRGGSR
jgi:tRNA threonylcarbamoyladenosine biosynthesis protein TsaB